MIVDTSAWIDLFRRKPTPAAARLAMAMAMGEALFVIPCVLQEVLQGSRDDDAFRALDRRLREVPMLLVDDPTAAARLAAEIYARSRWSGVTPRSPIDCLVAATAIAADLPLLHHDRDFEQIARIDPRLTFVAL